MRPRRTPRTRDCLELPGGNEDNYLWMERASMEGAPVMLTYWEPTAEEIARIVGGEKIVLIMWGTVHTPVAMSTESQV